MVIVLAICWCSIIGQLWHRLRSLPEQIWLADDYQLILRRGQKVIRGQLTIPCFSGSYACLICYRDENLQRHWLWLAHDAMDQPQFRQLNRLVRQFYSDGGVG